MLDALREQSETISTEALGNSDAAQHALDRLPKFIDDAKNYFTQAIGEPLLQLFSHKTFQGFNKTLSKVAYTRLSKSEVSVPAGLSTDLITYGNALLKAAHVTSSLQKDVLNPFATWLSEHLADPSSLASLRPALEIQGYVRRNVDAEVKHLLQCFNDKHVNGKLPYGKAVRRNADWNEVAAMAESLQACFLKDDHHKIAKKVGETTNLMETLITRITESPEEYKISPSVLSALAKTSYGIAKEIEFYGLVRARVVEYIKSIEAASAEVQHYLKQEGLMAA